MQADAIYAIAALIALLLSGIPIALSLMLSGALGLWLLDFPMLTVVQRFTAGSESFVLLAIPFFILAGAVMETGGISRRLIAFCDACFGFLPGGLANANIGASMIFGGISGSAVADTSAVGSVMIPAMEREGYSREYSAAITAATSPVGMIIPPSIPMIIWSFISGQSLNELFLAGIIPGILITLGMALVSTWICQRRGYQAGFRPFRSARFMASLKDGLLAIGAPAIIIGGILSGIFTPTEASVVVLAYALAVSLVVYREASFAQLRRVLVSAGITSASIMFIICGATVFSFFLTVAGVPAQIGSLILGISDGPLGFIIAAGVLMFVLGMFLDTTTTILMAGPIIIPLFSQVGIDPLVATMVILVVLAIGLITPPVGLCLFVVASITPVRVSDVARECVPFIAVMLAVAALIWIFPATVAWVTP
ncbi:MAG: TRAP transporter large permease [Tropicimonas sp.]|uniref:TRAP transporter large permease n=1 Tax=Tropicimonas sp. TaxID=2067044 RepID=UPI003A8C69E1